jgi:uncharacterized phage-associated protein
MEKLDIYTLATMNFFIDRANVEGIDDMTPQKLQRLVYEAHGWHLALLDEPLVERVEAWGFGPVIPLVYNKLRHLGNDPLPDFYEVQYTEWSDDVIATACLPRFIYSSDTAPSQVMLLSRVWDIYKTYTGGQLSQMAHAEGTPWNAVYRPGVPTKTINDDLIKNYFKGLTLEKERGK